MIEAGGTAPDFTLPDREGEPITLSSLRGPPVVLYFYPRAGREGSESSKGLLVRARRDPGTSEPTARRVGWRGTRANRQGAK